MRSRLRAERVPLHASRGRHEQRIWIRRHQFFSHFAKMRGLMSNPAAVVVTGIGLVCPLGDSSRMVYSGLCDGRSALARVEPVAGETRSARLAGTLASDAIDRHLTGRNLNPLDRSARLLAAAAQLALAESRWLPADPRRG